MVITRHDFGPTDTEGHAMACINCGRPVSFNDRDDWERARQEQCNNKNWLADAKPILFNEKMNLAILNNEKNTTRRLVNPQPIFGQSYRYKNRLLYDGEEAVWCYKNHIAPDPRIEMDWLAQFAPFRPGDIVYVREKFYQYGEWYNGPTKVNEVDGEDVLKEKFHFIPTDSKPIYFENTRPANLKICMRGDGKGYYRRPSLFMPKEIARTFLRIENVKIDRVQSLTSEDAFREGYKASTPEGPITWFKTIWNGTIAEKDIPIFGWDANPCIWIYELKKIYERR